MNKTKQNQYNNTVTAQDAAQRASIRARSELSAQGVLYPTRTPGMPISEFYDAMLDYGQKEANLTIDYLKSNDKPKLVVVDLKPKQPFTRQYGRPYHDD